MIIKFDKPIPLEEANKLYNDTVKFITNTENYPNVEAIEFKGDPRYIFKSKFVSPKVTKKSNKIIDKYNKKIDKIWTSAFKSIRESIRHLNKTKKIDITKEQRNTAFDIIDELKTEFETEAKNRFDEAFKVGKIRGQLISGQEMDDDLYDTDEELIERRLEENEEYLAVFAKDLKDGLDKVFLEGPYDSYEELDEIIQQKVETPKKSRAFMYSLATLGLIAAGMVKAFKDAKPELGERKVYGGYWTIHPDEGKMGKVCPGCLENSGKWFTIDEFEKEYQTNHCLTRCRCDLDTI